MYRGRHAADVSDYMHVQRVTCLCAEVAVQMRVHGEWELAGIHEWRGGGVWDNGSDVIREGEELVHHIGTGQVNCRKNIHM